MLSINVLGKHFCADLYNISIFNMILHDANLFDLYRNTWESKGRMGCVGGERALSRCPNFMPTFCCHWIIGAGSFIMKKYFLQTWKLWSPCFICQRTSWYVSTVEGIMGQERQGTEHVKKARLTIYKTQSWDTIITPFLRMEPPWVNHLLKALPSSYCYNGNSISAAVWEGSHHSTMVIQNKHGWWARACVSICCSSYCRCGSFIFSTWHHVELPGNGVLHIV